MSELVKKIKDWTIRVGIAAAVITAGYSYFVPDTVRTKINETIVKRYDDADKYLVFTDADVFENTDAWYRLKFRSSDIQAQLMKSKGKELDITKYGWRFGFLSWYENIVGVQEVKPEQK